ncbi:hypothetical protein BH11MYX4_BH11MYX4_39660 [soil metagenome]
MSKPLAAVVLAGLLACSCLSSPGTTAGDAGGADDGGAADAGDGAVADAGGDGDRDDGSAVCQASSCTGGVCFPDGCHAVTTLVPTMYEATRKIVLTTDTVFFIDMLETSGGFSSHVGSVPKAGGPTRGYFVPTGAGSDVLADFATDGTNVFVTITTQQVNGSAPGIYRCDAIGCATTAPFATDGSALSLSVQGGFVYWVDTPGGDVFRCPVTGCGGGPENVAPAPVGAAGTKTNLITTDASNVYVAYGSGLLGVAPLGAGGAVTSLGSGTVGFRDLVVDSTNVYVADVNGVVSRCAKAGCAGGLATIATKANARSLATDGTTLFWLGAPGGTVWSAPVGGSAARAVFAAPDGFERSPAPARALAVDATSFFFGGEGVFRANR